MTNPAGVRIYFERQGISAQSTSDDSRTAFGIYLASPKMHSCCMKILELNHVAIHVSDVERSRAFYRDVLRLEKLPRPAFDFPGAWFRLGVVQELHLIGRRGPMVVADGNNHFALRVDDLAAWENHLRAAGAEFVSRLRPDGASQVFLHDPDGYFIELFSF
jgi:catechol 2,3-dioxygenase-like lactoylglutathione lyase family enzyme